MVKKNYLDVEDHEVYSYGYGKLIPDAKQNSVIQAELKIFFSET